MKATKKHSSTTSKPVSKKKLQAALTLVKDEFFVRSREDQLAAKKAEEECARREALYDTEALSAIHHKLYEAQGLCKALYLAQRSDTDEGPEDLAGTDMADVSLIVHRILSDVQEKLDSFEDDIGEPRPQKAAAAQEVAHG